MLRPFEMKLTLFIMHIDERRLDHSPNCKKALVEDDIDFVWQNTKLKSILIQLQTEFENCFLISKISHVRWI
jgi:hypothetical protein